MMNPTRKACEEPHRGREFLHPARPRGRGDPVLAPLNILAIWQSRDSRVRGNERSGNSFTRPKQGLMVGSLDSGAVGRRGSAPLVERGRGRLDDIDRVGGRKAVLKPRFQGFFETLAPISRYFRVLFGIIVRNGFLRSTHRTPPARAAGPLRSTPGQSRPFPAAADHSGRTRVLDWYRAVAA
jgi:hypothetical protein